MTSAQKILLSISRVTNSGGEETWIESNDYMNSQRKNSNGKIQLHKSVHAVAEIFVTTGQTRLLNVDQLMQFIEKYPHDDMSQI
jgi:hypothetical protein